ncbi:hypothetical protein [Tunturiibacter gelidiferens]|uniref:hypothetical protein n=1 Tax=Tunturiibacter gelidiferens TaxID=3069689 RepID=UPI003D9BBC99
MQYSGKLEYAQQRKIRERNTALYRLAHWPIWIWVFFLAPGPLTFSLCPRLRTRQPRMVDRRPDRHRHRRPARQPSRLRAAPLHPPLRRGQAKSLYRRVCYTFAWNAVLSFALLNLSGLLIAAATGHWYMQQIYRYAYFPLCGTILLLGAAGLLPRVRPSTQGEGTERRYFYGSVWAVTISQALLLAFWKTLPETRAASLTKLAIFASALLLMGLAAYRGTLPRTRPIVPGELMVAD